MFSCSSLTNVPIPCTKENAVTKPIHLYSQQTARQRKRLITPSRSNSCHRSFEEDLPKRQKPIFRNDKCSRFCILFSQSSRTGFALVLNSDLLIIARLNILAFPLLFPMIPASCPSSLSTSRLWRPLSSALASTPTRTLAASLLLFHNLQILFLVFPARTLPSQGRRRPVLLFRATYGILRELTLRK
jgi:hypothetical protein